MGVTKEGRGGGGEENGYDEVAPAKWGDGGGGELKKKKGFYYRALFAALFKGGKRSKVLFLFSYFRVMRVSGGFLFGK